MRSPLFEGITRSELDPALRGAERRRVGKGGVLAAEGDYLAEMYVLESGSAEVGVSVRHGREQVVAHVGPGETIGEMSLLTREPASATVRAVDDVELLVLKAEDLEALMDRLPRIQRNVIHILSERLARMTRLAASEPAAKVVLLEDHGGPELLGYALACSMAWHTRAPTLLVVVAGDAPPALVELVTASPEPPTRPRGDGGADLMVAHPRDGFEAGTITATLSRLARAFEYVLVQAQPDTSWPSGLGRVVRLGSSEAPPDGGFAIDVSGVAGTASGSGVRWMPELDREERAGLARGVLTTAGAGGRALGGLARELAQLKVGIALGSGSIRGYAHVGVLRGLETHGIPVDCLSGTSIGAIVAGLYAYLQDTDRVADFLDELGARMFRPTLSRNSLLSTRAMRSYIERVVGDGLLEDLPIPVAVVATDIDTQEEVVLRRGSGVTALFASSAMPGILPAVRVGNRRLVDGGIVNPIPASVAAELGAGVVLAVRLVTGGGVELDAVSEEGEGPIPSAVAAVVSSIELVQTRITTSAGTTPLVMITPQLDAVPAAKLRRFREGRRYIPAGEAAVDDAMPRLRAALPWLRD